ncbi:MAG: hypothetical protein ACI8ZX_000807 [Planctomycetota bacterium]|jgi:hypothetical protein
MKNLLLFSAIFLSFSGITAQSFYDLNTIQEIKITFSQSNWDQILDAEASSTEDYTMAQTVTINGTIYDSVGVKYKGNSTYNANQTKNPFHIELDTYKDQDYEGYKDIKLSNVAKDPSFLREVLSYQIIRQYMHAPESNYANVYVNGTLIGLYSNSEAITKTFVDDRFYSNDNAFVKCNPPAGAGPQTTDLPNLEYLNNDSANYYDAYEMKSDFGWSELIDLCDTLKNTTSAIEEILDVDRAIWMLANDNVLVNLDSYIGGFAQNYYLYRDDNNRFNPIIWDLNESFGVFSSTGSGNLNSNTSKQQLSHLLHENDTDYPLMQELMAVPMFKRMYLAHYKTILLENFDNGTYATTAQTLHTLIDASVQADVNKFFTYANFTANINSDVSGGGGGPGPGGLSTIGITNLMNTRSSYLLGLSDFTNTQPTISNVALSNASPVLNEVITITADITDENDVYLGHRESKKDRFTRIQMFDDGAHNDGAANDGTYGIALTITNASIHYYIYAENSNIGKFSPVRAEHEYHRIDATATSSSISGIVINELLASNDASNFDEAGEYDDWIELFNNTDAAVDLEGFHLSDDLNDLMQWEFPAGAILPANGYLTVWLDNNETQGDYHTNFKLSSGGETVYFSDTQAGVIDQVTYDDQTTDVSYGRFANGTGSFQELAPTFGTENALISGINHTKIDDSNIKFFPNPAQDYFTIIIENIEPIERTIKLVDVFGKLVFESTIEKELTINTSNLTTGIYFAIIDYNVSKVIIQ